jgi:hypothetical protein
VTVTARRLLPRRRGPARSTSSGLSHFDRTLALDFPPDVPAPKDHLSCLQACSIVDTRCHRTAPMGREAFLGCVEKHQICDAKCEEVFPFFGR